MVEIHLRAAANTDVTERTDAMQPASLGGPTAARHGRSAARTGTMLLPTLGGPTAVTHWRKAERAHTLRVLMQCCFLR